MNVLLGSGAPGAGTGVDGDIYINTANYDLYGPKAAGAWGAVVISGVTPSSTTTLTNKTLTTPTMTTPSMTTPKISDSAGGQFYNFAVSNLAADRTVTLPLLAANDVFVFEAFTQTLTNKTISGASNTITNLSGTNISSGTVAAARGGIGADASGYTGALIFASGTPSAVAPSTSGNVLTSNGTTWTSAAPSAAHTGQTTFTGIITPTALSANTNDWSPTGLSTCNVIRVDGGAWNLTGIAAQPSGTVLLLVAITSAGFSLSKEDAGSSAANRFAGSGSKTISGNMGALVWYDGTSSRWRIID